MISLQCVLWKFLRKSFSCLQGNMGEMVLENLGEVRVRGLNPNLEYIGRITKNLEPEGSEMGTYVCFFGIPYALPPIGFRRFQPPEPYETEDEVYEALQIKPKCIQYDNTTWKITGSEDCLYLNIYIPKKPEDIREPLAVLVYFHGGGLSMGSGNYSDVTPDSLMKEDIIFVTVNYRLGVFGFLNMLSEQCTGNAGLKDQVMALKWVRMNIESFGGNPHNITICGESAGGSCVNFHMISPLSKGLFHKAIVQSGGIYCPWGFTGHHRQKMARFREHTKAYVHYSEFEHLSRDEVLEALQVLTAEELKNMYQIFTRKEKLAESHLHGFNIFMGASGEKFSEDAFIHCDKIENLMRQAEPIPILAGINEKEGYMAFCTYFDENLRWIKNIEEFKTFLKVNLRWQDTTAEKIASDLRDRYFPNVEMMSNDKIKGRMVDFCTDLWFYRFYENFQFGNTSSPNESSAPLYVYKFNYFTEINTNWRDLTFNIDGAGHKDECNYLFPSFQQRRRNSPYSRDVQDKVKTMCSLWASFCKEGTPKSALHPDVVWSPHTEDNPCYLSIGNELKLVNERLNEERWEFLRENIPPPDPSLGSTPLTPGCYYTNMEYWPVKDIPETTDASSTPGCSYKPSDRPEGLVTAEEQHSSELPAETLDPLKRPSNLSLSSVNKPSSGTTPPKKERQEKRQD